MRNTFAHARKLAVAFIGILALLAGKPALAWDGAITGVILQIDVTGGNSFGFRVILDNGPSACTGGPNWSYLNETDSNYKTYVAALLAARAQGLRVIIYSTLENGYCHIGYISMQ